MQKRYLNFQGKTIVLTKHEYAKFVIRFNLNNAHADFNRDYWIAVECPTCILRGTWRECKGCTFKKFHTQKAVGCWVFLKRLWKHVTGRKLPASLQMTMSGVGWNHEDQTEVKKFFEFIQGVLAGMSTRGG